ncbi:GWxTD domain-containing protein [Balneola vulgaris]|uniref:GWxTD domain-containing protein n=1 Tax=Balneola vulgaris TaxID=287535 RepID=UPI00036BD8B4|nr:GWxTD domain-containing protein [Balneola vulgaris]
MNKITNTLLAFGLIILLGTDLYAQRRGDVTYTSLVNRASVPTLFFDELIIPSSNSDNHQLLLTFSMSNNFLPFKKITLNDEVDKLGGNQFYTTARFSADIFRGKASKKELENLATVARDVWQDTLYAASFEDTKSEMLFSDGVLKASLNPGTYNFVLQLSTMGETNERNSQRQDIEIPDFKTKKMGEIYLIDEVTSEQNGSQFDLKLVNRGNSVRYGENYHLLIRIPNYNSNSSYSAEISKANIGRKDTTVVSVRENLPISADNIFSNSELTINDTNSPSLSLNKENGSFTYALIEVPNKNYENSVYKIIVKEGQSKKPIATKVVRSFWPDIPPALLNLDVSIDLLMYILPEDRIKAMKDGNAQEKEKRFRAFWEQRDPTPDSEFNELMTEYYRRIDFAFREYRNPENPDGHETDRGKIYIKYGPPSARERSFPSKGRVIETWTYPNRNFVFEKGTGFSDFILLGKE